MRLNLDPRKQGHDFHRILTNNGAKAVVGAAVAVAGAVAAAGAVAVVGAQLVMVQ